MSAVMAGGMLSEDERSELRASVKSIRQQWRDSLVVAKRLGGGSKLRGRAEVVWRDLDTFEDRVKEAGGEEGLMTLLCAHVAGGGSVEDFCGHYVIDAGLMGAFVSEKPERLERLHNALVWLAEVDVSRTVPLADEATLEDVKVRSLQIKTRMDRAALYSPARFGKKEEGLARGLENLADVLQRISERKRAPVVLGAVSDVVVIKEKESRDGWNEEGQRQEGFGEAAEEVLEGGDIVSEGVPEGEVEIVVPVVQESPLEPV